MPRSPIDALPATPFRLQPSLADVVEHRNWRHARLLVLDALERGESVALLGPTGTGKTLLLRSVAQALQGLGWHVATAGDGGAHAAADVVLVDEAGSLSAQALVELGALACPFVLAALPGIAPRLSNLARRIAWVTLGPLSAEEVGRMVAARMRAAGRDRDAFDPEALRSLAHHSGGRLRLVLVLAGAALFMADREGAARVTSGHVDEAAAMRAGPEDPGEDILALPVAPLGGEAPARVAQGVQTRARLGDGGPRRRVVQTPATRRAWLPFVTVGLAATGLALVAVAAVVGPRLVQPPIQRAEAPPLTAVVPPPPVDPPAPAPADPPPADPPPVVPPPVVPPPVVPLADDVPPAPLATVPPVPVAPPPVPPARRPPAVARPTPPAAVPPLAPVIPRAQLRPMPDEPVPPPPWPVERSLPSAEAEAPAVRRIVTREPANIRGQPSLGSPVVRLTSAGMVLRVFAQRGPWLQVGDSGAWGWVHTDVVQQVP